jgi:fructokinase
VRRPAPPVEVVDTVGAGDAFTAGLLGALADRGALGRTYQGGRLAAVDLPAVLDRSCLVAALTCARAGADPPTRAEVQAAERDLA